MQDQPSNSDKGKEPPRPRNLPDDLIWDPELEAWIQSGEATPFDHEAWERKFAQHQEEHRREPPIPPEKLRVPPGVLEVPAAWRKSLGGGERDLFSELPEDDENFDDEQLASVEPD
ncbi:MAG TPA: hypothetical protein VFW33_06500 [Gemmataceae bacterium]|nr:hypothetical protein [Gemmataceae bacterium]